MKKYILMILAIFISILLFSQNIRKDFCIFIDGKMVREIEDSFFIYKDSLGIEKKINFIQAIVKEKDGVIKALEDEQNSRASILMHLT
ncbi:MAG: hypothetical protein DRN27_09640, partial [Thermoplasmata archaeon]